MSYIHSGYPFSCMAHLPLIKGRRRGDMSVVQSQSGLNTSQAGGGEGGGAEGGTGGQQWQEEDFEK